MWAFPSPSSLSVSPSLSLPSLFPPSFMGVNMRCGYGVPKTILLQAYLYIYSLPREVTFELLPLNRYALSITMLPLLKTFLELLLWNSFQWWCHNFFGYIQYTEIFIPLRQILFSETVRSHSEPN